ncbi:MAG TPA: L-threonylcarbamoyladenylate synthase [Chloroflexia bacterium]|nr:L-threonylcarbamoyladenylate synthase [Chloroflexia bacterium]
MPIREASPETWRLAAQAVAAGDVVAFPTDTVYGVGCDPYCVAAINAIYQIKGRAQQKALPLLLSGQEQLTLVAGALPDAAARLGEQFWPGALTLVVPRAAGLPDELGGGTTIAVRVPAHDDLRAFIEACGGAMASTSANLSGQPDALDAGQVAGYFGESIDMIVDGGRVQGGVPSTVVDCTVEPPGILRQGAVSESAIRALLEGV